MIECITIITSPRTWISPSLIISSAQFHWDHEHDFGVHAHPHSHSHYHYHSASSLFWWHFRRDGLCHDDQYRSWLVTLAYCGWHSLDLCVFWLSEPDKGHWYLSPKPFGIEFVCSVIMRQCALNPISLRFMHQMWMCKDTDWRFQEMFRIRDWLKVMNRKKFVLCDDHLGGCYWVCLWFVWLWFVLLFSADRTLYYEQLTASK